MRKNHLIKAFLAIFLFAVALPCVAEEKSIDLNTFNVEADNYKKNSQLNEMTFSGDVQLTFYDVKIYGDKIIVTQNNSEPEKVIGIGNIIFQQQLKNVHNVAHVECESITLYPKPGKISFYTPKSVNINGSRYTGSVINYDIIKEEVTVIIQ